MSLQQFQALLLCFVVKHNRARTANDVMPLCSNPDVLYSCLDAVKPMRVGVGIAKCSTIEEDVALEKSPKRPHQQNGALRAPFLLAFFGDLSKFWFFG